MAENIRATLIKLIQLADEGNIEFISGHITTAWDQKDGGGALSVEWRQPPPSYNPVDNTLSIAVENWPVKDGDGLDEERGENG